MTDDTYLIVNADDFGLTPAITQGTIKSIADGLVNSVSIAANGSDLENACNFLKDHPKISPGWHINLTSGKPISGSSDRHLFKGKNKLFAAELLNQLDVDSIKSELFAQWNQLNAWGLNITHVDSHHDIHFMPQLRGLIVEFIKELGIPFLRYSGSRLYKMPVTKIIKNGIEFGITNCILRLFSIKGTHDVDFIQFRELYQSPNKAEILHLYINRLKPGTTLWICHPGYADPENPMNLNYNHSRQLETEALCLDSVRKALNENNIKLVNFRDVMYA